MPLAGAHAQLGVGDEGSHVLGVCQAKPVELESFSRTVAGLGLYWLLINEPPQRNG